MGKNIVVNQGVSSEISVAAGSGAIVGVAIGFDLVMMHDFLPLVALLIGCVVCVVVADLFYRLDESCQWEENLLVVGGLPKRVKNFSLTELRRWSIRKIFRDVVAAIGLFVVGYSAMGYMLEEPLAEGYLPAWFFVWIISLCFFITMVVLAFYCSVARWTSIFGAMFGTIVGLVCCFCGFIHKDSTAIVVGGLVGAFAGWLAYKLRIVLPDLLVQGFECT